MSASYEQDFEEFVTGGMLLPMITSEAIVELLSDFELELSSTTSPGWLAMACRRALGMTLTSSAHAPNVEVRDTIDRMSNIAQHASSELIKNSRRVDSRLWNHAWDRWTPDEDAETVDGVVLGPPTDYLRYERVLSELDWLIHFLRDASRGTDVVLGPSKTSKERELRIHRAQYLAAIYVVAFGCAPTANNFPNEARFAKPTPFMIFFEKMMFLAFGIEKTPNSAGVVKEACKRHRQQSASFGSFIPGI